MRWMQAFCTVFVGSQRQIRSDSSTHGLPQAELPKSIQIQGMYSAMRPMNATHLAVWWDARQVLVGVVLWVWSQMVVTRRVSQKASYQQG